MDTGEQRRAEESSEHERDQTRNAARLLVRKSDGRAQWVEARAAGLREYREHRMGVRHLEVYPKSFDARVFCIGARRVRRP